MLDLVRRDPRCLGHDQTRWTRRTLQASCGWLGRLSLSAVGKLLARLGVRLRRGQDHVHSPDPAYHAKRDWIRAAVAASRPGGLPGPRTATLFLDEVTIHRQPTLARAWAARGGPGPRAERSHRGDTPTRVVATLDAETGQVRYHRCHKVTVATLVRFYQELVAAAAARGVDRLFIVQDNWPVHWHPDLLVALELQESPFPRHLPPSWSREPSAAAIRRWGGLALPIQLVPLPTYASWLNPIEKLWRWLRQDVGHLHRWANDIPGLRVAIDAFLDRFAEGSEPLVRYCGLDPPH